MEVEQEEWDQVEDMEVVDSLREERLERVRRSQLEWTANMICKEMVRGDQEDGEGGRHKDMQRHS